MQGGSNLIQPTTGTDNLSITIGANGAVVASGNRAFDLDGSGHTTTNASVVNAGTIYSAGDFTISMFNFEDSTLTNEATGSITGSRIAILANTADNVTINNAGTIAVNDDGISYRNGQTLSRYTQTDGRTIYAENGDNLTLINSGTISSKTRQKLYLVG